MVYKMQIDIKNIKNVRKIYPNGVLRIREWNKYTKKGALTYVEKLDEFSYKVSLITNGEFLDNKTTE